MKSEIDTTLLLFLYQNLLTCTLYLKRNCLYICFVYKINEKEHITSLYSHQCNVHLKLFYSECNDFDFLRIKTLFLC